LTAEGEELIEAATRSGASITSPGGELVATSSVDETVKLWNLEGKLLATLKGHGSGVRTLTFRKDGQILTSVGDDGSLVFWNIPTILKLQPLEYACNWVRDYLHTNPGVTEGDRADDES
jgi:WD40 repeat protein